MGQLKDKNGNDYNPTTTTNDVTDGTQTLEQRLQSIEQGSGIGDASVTKTGTKLEGQAIGGISVGGSMALADKSSCNVFVYDVAEGEVLTIKCSCQASGSFNAYCFVDKADIVLAKPSFAYSANVQTFANVLVPHGAVKLYANELYATNGASTSVTTTKLDGMALAPYRNIIRDGLKFSDKDAQTHYDLGAQKMDTYNLVREKVGIITIGQSNAANRIAAADFPSSATINGSTIALSKSVPTCKLIQGSTENTYDNNTKSFAALNNTGAWSFDQVLYNAVANALGSETDFYVCKQARGGTPLQKGWQSGSSFWPRLDDFKSVGQVSQLYHLKILVQRALELQPDIKFKAIIMHQGEGDNGTKFEGQYYMALCEMIQWIRGLVGSPKLPFIFGSIPTNSISFSQIIYNDMQRAAADLNDVYLVTMGEATDWVDDQWHSGTTGLHFGANTAVKLADDMYKLMVSRKMLAPYV